MTTIADLVVAAPVVGHGYPIQATTPAGGQWRFVLELADPSAGSAITWHELTPYYAGDAAERGANDYRGRYVASVVEVQLQAPDDRLAPWGLDTSSVFGTDVELDAGLLMRAALTRVVSGSVVQWLPLWTGRVETWGDASYARGHYRVHRVTVVDTLGDLVNVPIPSMGFADPWDERIGGAFGILHFSDWPFGWDIYGDTGSPAMPLRDDTPSAINEIDAVADPVGVVWRTLRNGRLVVHPAPWDMTHTNRYPNPLLDSYPEGVVFTFSPSTGEVAYATGATDRQPFGVPRTSRSVINSITATMPAGVYPADDPVSQAKYGVKPLAVSWLIDNTAAVDQLLAARAYATSQAEPLQTSIDLEGFFPALAMLDHLDPVTIRHTTHEGGYVVAAAGTVRHLSERRTRRPSGLSWTTTVQADIDAVTAVPQLLPVDNLRITAYQANYVDAAWENPAQTITPTDTQIRVLGYSSVWIDWPYPITAWSSPPLEPDTSYTLEVRLVEKVNGLILHASPTRSVGFHTNKPWVPTPDPDGPTVDVPDMTGDDDACEMHWRLERSSAPGVWATVDTGDESDMIDNGDGTFTLPFDESTYEAGYTYRVISWEVCDGVPGTEFVGPSYDPPDDYLDPCGDPPPSLGVAPYNDTDDLLVYVPDVCYPDTIREAVSGIAGVKGSGFGDILADYERADYVALGSNARGGIVAYGECPQITGHTGDKSLLARVFVGDDVDTPVVAECAAMRLGIAALEGTGTFRFTVTLYKPGVTITLPTAATHAVGVSYYVAATYDAGTGDLLLYVNAVNEGSASGAAVHTINAMPIWSVGAPPNSWVTDVALFDRVLDPSELPAFPNPTVTINQAAGQADPTNVSPILFDVVFSEPVTLFTSADIAISGTAGATTAVPSGVVGGATYTVSVSGMTSNGTVILTVPAGGVVSVDTGLPNLASTSTDNTVNWTGSIPPLDAAILALNPLSYWKLRGNDANTLHDYGSLATADLVNTGGAITLNSTAGQDGYNYPRKGLTTSGAVLLGSDHNSYTHTTAGGLTIFYLYRPFGSSSSRVVCKDDSSGAGEWHCSHNDSAGTVQCTTLGASGAADSTITGNVVVPSAWNAVVCRIPGTGKPTIRNDMLNCGGTTSGVLAFRGNTAVTVKLFGHGGTVGPANCSLAHVAIFAGQLTDAQLRTLEVSALADGWTLGVGTSFTGGTVTTPGDGYKYHKFTANGTLTCVTPGLIEMVAIGGAGGGGIATTNGPGGGGAGGKHQLAAIVSTNQTVTIGTGGAATPATGVFAVAGANTTIGSVATGNGGGGGGTRSSWRGGGAGGCGGGGGDSSGGGAIGSQGGSGGAGWVGWDGLTYGQGGAGRGATTQPTQTPQTANSGNGGNATTAGEAGNTGVVLVRYPV